MNIMDHLSYCPQQNIATPENCLWCATERGENPFGNVMPVSTKTLEFSYTNYRGETSIRRDTPISIRWGATEWHPIEGWLMLAFDHDKESEREFALEDCNFEKTEPE